MEDKFLEKEDFIKIDDAAFYEQAKYMVKTKGDCGFMGECTSCFLRSANVGLFTGKKKCYSSESILKNAETFVKAYEELKLTKVYNKGKLKSEDEIEYKFLTKEDFIDIDNQTYYNQAKNLFKINGRCKEIKSLSCDECFLKRTNISKTKHELCTDDYILKSAEIFIKAYNEIQNNKITKSECEGDNVKIQEDGFIEISKKERCFDEIMEELIFLRDKRNRLRQMLESTIDFLKCGYHVKRTADYGYIGLDVVGHTLYMPAQKIANSESRIKEQLIRDIEDTNILIEKAFKKYSEKSIEFYKNYEKK